MTETKTEADQIVIYKAPTGPKLKLRLKANTVWINQHQIADLFGVNIPAVAKHIKNIFSDGELAKTATVSKMETVQQEGKRQIKRLIEFYNLDVIISVGYRVNSKKATQFRIWATQTLREFLVKGLVVNERRLLESQETKIRELQLAHKLIQKAVESKKLEGFEKDLLHIISDYTNTWFILNRFDSGKLLLEGLKVKAAKPLSYEQAIKVIERFRERLFEQNQASNLFGQEVGPKLTAVLGSITQSFNGKTLYPTLEEKAAHLFYLLVKDHPFVDGNKRIGSLLFILFLIQNNCLYNSKGERKINDSALTALALLIAESEPSQKDIMIKLIVNLIKR